MKNENETVPRNRPGMTLIELTVVIIVLLTLISVLFFVGAGYIKASNRSACLTQQSHIQKGVRGFQSLKQLSIGDTFQWADLNADGYLADPLKMACPSNKEVYFTAPSAEIPPVGTRVGPCVDTDYAAIHTPESLALW